MTLYRFHRPSGQRGGQNVGWLTRAVHALSCACGRAALAYFGGLPAVFTEIVADEADEEVAWPGMTKEILPAA